MGLAAWITMGLAIWHFTVWVPDRFWGGIVGAFLGALIGAAVVGLAIHGFSVPARHATNLGTALEGIPGAIIGMGLVYAEGIRRERVRRPSGKSYKVGSSCLFWEAGRTAENASGDAVAEGWGHDWRTQCDGPPSYSAAPEP